MRLGSIFSRHLTKVDLLSAREHHRIQEKEDNSNLQAPRHLPTVPLKAIQTRHHVSTYPFRSNVHKARLGGTLLPLLTHARTHALHRRQFFLFPRPWFPSHLHSCPNTLALLLSLFFFATDSSRQTGRKKRSDSKRDDKRFGVGVGF